jgi:hypothetical protein
MAESLEKVCPETEGVAPNTLLNIPRCLGTRAVNELARPLPAYEPVKGNEEYLFESIQ